MSFFGRPDPAPIVLRQLGRAIPLARDARIVVLGCDSGIDAFAIAGRARGEVVGVDVDEPSVAEASAARDVVRATGFNIPGRLRFEHASVFTWLRAQPRRSIAALIDTVGFHNFVLGPRLRDGSTRAVGRARALVREYARVLRDDGAWVLTVRRTHSRNRKSIPGHECVANAEDYAAERFIFEQARAVKLPEYRGPERSVAHTMRFPAYHTVARPRR